MTTFAAGHSVGQSPPRVGVAMVVRWSVARTARGGGGAAELTVTVDDRRVVAELRGVDGAELVGEGGPVRIERVGEMEHVDVPGVVSLSVRRGADGVAELLYARTPLLEAIGVPGGCAERPEMVVAVG